MGSLEGHEDSDSGPLGVSNHDSAGSSGRGWGYCGSAQEEVLHAKSTIPLFLTMLSIMPEEGLKRGI